MSTLVQQYTDAVTRSQAVFAENAQAWVQYLQEGTQPITDVSNPREVNPTELVNGTFDRIERLVGLQRDLYHGLAEAMTPYVESLAIEASKVTERATETFNHEANGAPKNAATNSTRKNAPANGARKNAPTNSTRKNADTNSTRKNAPTNSARKNADTNGVRKNARAKKSA